MTRGHRPREYATPLDDAVASTWQRIRTSQFARDLPWLAFAAAWVLALTILAIHTTGA
jgi:hypothetical protein